MSVSVSVFLTEGSVTPEDQLEVQTGQIYELKDIDHSIRRCRHLLNTAHHNVELKQRTRTQLLVQYAGADSMADGLHLERRPAPDQLSYGAKDLTETDIEALKIADPSAIQRAILDAEAQIVSLSQPLSLPLSLCFSSLSLSLSLSDRRLRGSRLVGSSSCAMARTALRRLSSKLGTYSAECIWKICL